jgi:dTDP-glucose 4,6-dehydratase
LELVKRILSVMSAIAGRSYSLETHVAYVHDRPGHDRRYAMDTSKMESQLSWRPHHTFESGFAATVKWYTSVQGREWLESLKKATDEVRDGQGRRK